MKKAQSTIELTLSLVVLVILLVGTIKVFIWITRTTVERDKKYLENFTRTFNRDEPFYRPSNASFVPQTRNLPEAEE
jgi:hypothetical protein